MIEPEGFPEHAGEQKVLIGEDISVRLAGPGGSFRIKMVAGNPVVGAMAGMLGNPAMMTAMGRVTRIGGQSFL